MIATMFAAVAGAALGAATVFAVAWLLDRQHREIETVTQNVLSENCPGSGAGPEAQPVPVAATAQAGSAAPAPVAVAVPDATLREALSAVAKLRHTASENLTYAQTLERMLGDARQEAEQQRDRADRLQVLYLRRTQQALDAGMRIVIDHAGRRANNRQP